jgi:hypothetical protein
MAYNAIGGFPPQQLPFSKKGKKWRKNCIDFGDNFSLWHYNVTRKSVEDMVINYDLLNGKIHMDDMKLIVNPYGIDASFIPDNIQHYPMINAKLKVLEGEESHRLFDFRVVVTNPNAVSEIEEEKNKQVNMKLQQLIADSSQSEEEYQQELQKISDYFTYEYQDKREVRANRILNHYILEQDLPQLFNKGFRDGYTVGEELYQCDIVSGEPFVEKLDPREVRIVRSGVSTNIEDADMIVIEQYWNRGRVIDTYYDQLTAKDVVAIDNLFDSNGTNGWSDSMANLDPRYEFYPMVHGDWTAGDAISTPRRLFDEDLHESGLPYDTNGNIRVLRVYWKSRRKIKKVKSYDPETGEEEFNFYPETYICDPDKGEEEESYWVNEAWEGTKIGKDIYVNMRPRPVQYNRLSNPSRCHFGIIGSIYSSNSDEPYSMVDIMKPYAYLYDIIHDRLNKIIAKNVGKVIRLDFAKTPKGWDADKWLYYINVNGIAVENSFKEGDYGAATGKLAGGLNNASNGVIDASQAQEIVYYTQLLDWIDTHCGNLVGMTPQRMGQVSNRETVGGVERATLQSSHSTEWLFFVHESVKKRVLECLLETTKICLKGRKKKFEFILEDGSKEIMEIDGDEYAECDYGLVVDNSNGAQELNQKLDMLAQAGLQNGMSFSTIMKIYLTKSLSEKVRMVENDEKRRNEQAQMQQQKEYELQQQQMQINAQIAQQAKELEYQMHREKLENNILVAEINSRAEELRMSIMNRDNFEANALEREKIAENARQFDARLKLDTTKEKDDVRLKEKQIAKQGTKKS